MSVFKDQKLFMQITQQEPSLNMATLYKRLITEEFEELNVAWYGFVAKDYVRPDMDFADRPDDLVEVVDALMDLIYVCAGMMHSLGLKPQELWDEVHRSNMSKFTRSVCGNCRGEGYMPWNSPQTYACEDCDGTGYHYEVKRRADGKILKPDSYSPPDLISILRKQAGHA
jgi:hypothetical protein